MYSSENGIVFFFRDTAHLDAPYGEAIGLAPTRARMADEQTPGVRTEAHGPGLLHRHDGSTELASHTQYPVNATLSLTAR